MDEIKLIRVLDEPLLAPINNRNHWWESGSVFNPGATVYNGKIHLVYRALGSFPYSSFGLAVLSSPTKVEYRSKLPFLEADEKNPYERFGIEDPRVSKIGDEYFISYTALSLYPGGQQVSTAWQGMDMPWRIRASVVTTKDFVDLDPKGVIMSNIDTKNVAFFPEKIEGNYVLLHRIHPDIWISTSSRLTGFEKGKVLCQPRADHWDNSRVGAGAQPIKTSLGWLLFYHGVDERQKGHSIYHTGILLLHPKDPTKILYRSEKPVFSPEKDWEKVGYVRDVVFPCGAVEWENDYYVYYGAADKRIGVASIEKKKLLDYLASKI